MDPDLLDVAIAVGAAARLTRLVVVDSIAAPARAGALRLGYAIAGDRGLVAADDLVSCPFCVGFWVAVAVVATYLAWGHTLAWQATAAAFALAWVAGHLTARLDAPEEPT